MFKHNLLIAFRNLKRYKSSFFINLIGLSTGLACSFLIYLWVNDELHFDKFHKNDTQLFQVMELSKENGNIIIHESTQGLLAETMKKDLPEVVSAVPIMNLEKEGMLFDVKAGDKVLRSAGIFAGKDLFNAFSFKLLQGDTKQVLAEKNNTVISENLANSLFGSVSNAIGKSIAWELMGKKNEAIVSGVFANPPANSSMKFDFALTYEMLLTEVWPNGQKWWNEGPATYLVLKEGTDIKKFNTRVEKFIETYSKGTIFTIFLRPYSSAYLYGKYENGIQAGGRIEYVKLFSIVALFILVIACINFMNLSTAKASRRLKEVGIKKAIGSTRRALIIQFLSEAMFMAFLSLMVACVIIVSVLPVFNFITGKDLGFSFSPKIIALMLIATIITGLVSGSYPAFYLSGFNAVSVLKGKLKNSMGELLARKGLVVFQFMISLVLIIAVMIIYKQMSYIQSKNLGYDKANIVYFDKQGTVSQNPEAFLAELKKMPGIVNASAIQSNVAQGIGSAATYGVDWPGKSEKDLINFNVQAVDFDMLETLSIPMSAGRSFSRNFGAEEKQIIFNETAINMMKLKDPIGKTVKMWGEDKIIAGVVKDFHMKSLHENIGPMLFFYKPQNTAVIMAKIAPGKEKETLGKLEAFYKKYNPGYVFEYKFLDEAYQAQYISEKRVSVLSAYFAGLAIIISCLGLFGLAAFNAEVRTKEIGIRKVLGATASNVIIMLSKDFIKLILISIVIAFPLAWWAMTAWLSGFAYRIDIGAGVFIIAGLSILAITLLTVTYQSLRTALMNPVKSLRSE